MTCIAAIPHKDIVYVAADSMGVVGDEAYQSTTPKILKRDGIIVGGAGSGVYIQEVQTMNLPKILKNEELYTYAIKKLVPRIRKLLDEKGIEKEDGVILLAYKGSIVVIWGCLTVERFENIEGMAIGSGSLPARGALYATKNSRITPHSRLKLAMESAEKFTTHVRKPFLFLDTKD